MLERDREANGYAARREESFVYSTIKGTVISCKGGGGG